MRCSARRRSCPRTRPSATRRENPCRTRPSRSARALVSAARARMVGSLSRRQAHSLVLDQPIATARPQSDPEPPLPGVEQFRTASGRVDFVEFRKRHPAGAPITGNHLPHRRLPLRISLVFRSSSRSTQERPIRTSPQSRAKGDRKAPHPAIDTPSASTYSPFRPTNIERYIEQTIARIGSSVGQEPPPTRLDSGPWSNSTRRPPVPPLIAAFRTSAPARTQKRNPMGSITRRHTMPSPPGPRTRPTWRVMALSTSSAPPAHGVRRTPASPPGP